MKIIFLNYQVNQKHSFLFSNKEEYDAFISLYKLAEQDFNNKYISESTTFIDYRIDNSGIVAPNIDKSPQRVGYIIVENGDFILNFIVTSYERRSDEVIRFNVFADIFRNDLNNNKNGITDLSVYGDIEQSNGNIRDTDLSQVILPDVGNPVMIESETYPLRDERGTNWVVIICAETTLGNYGVFATDYASDIGTMTALARALTIYTSITRVSDQKETTFKATSCYIVPKNIIREGYNIPDLAYRETGHEDTGIFIYPINAFFKRTEIEINTTDNFKIYDFGTIGKRVKINNLYNTPVYVLSSFNSSDISIGIQYNDIYIDVTDEFSFPITTDQFAQYASLNKRDFAIKTVTSVGSAAVGAALTISGAMTGNLVQAGAGVASMISSVSKMASFDDKDNQPYSVTSNNDGCANITFNGGFSLRKYKGKNYEEAKRTINRFGYQYKNVVEHLQILLNITNRKIGTTFIKYKLIHNPEIIRTETFARLLNGVFV